MRGNKVKISDVARAAGVSRSTVSYVLSNKRSISTEVRQRVIEQIEALGYKPNAVARSLASRKTNTIGLYCSINVSNHDMFFLRMLNGIMESIQRFNYKVLLINEIEESPDYAVSVDATFPIDGAIIMNTRNSKAFLNELQRGPIPVVLVGKPPKDTNVHFIDNDNVAAAFEATKEFIQMDKQKIALVIGSAKEATVYTDYMTGYLLALSEHNIPFEEKYIIRLEKEKTESFEKAYEAIGLLEVDAVIMHVPISLTVRLIDKLYSNSGKNTQLSVAAFGLDLLNDFRSQWPQNVSVIHSNAYDLGFQAGTVMIDAIQEKNEGLIQQLNYSKIE